MTRRGARAVLAALAALVVLAAAGVGSPLAAQRIDPEDSTSATPARPAFSDAWWGEDKTRHLAASAAITALGYGGTRLVLDHDGSIGVAIGAAAVAGLLRELHDGRDGRFSYRDLVWDAIGIAAGYLWIREIQ